MRRGRVCRAWCAKICSWRRPRRLGSSCSPIRRRRWRRSWCPTCRHPSGWRRRCGGGRRRGRFCGTRTCSIASSRAGSGGSKRRPSSSGAHRIACCRWRWGRPITGAFPGRPSPRSRAAVTCRRSRRPSASRTSCSTSFGAESATRRRPMQFVCFHLMPWPHLPADFEQHHESAWLDLPNSLYDPVRGHTLYNEYLDQLVAADRLGFDVIGVNEHHQNAYGLMPSPNIMAASLIQRTSRIKILVLGNALPLYDHPQRVAEELAMLDVLSGGRLISGMVVGLGVEAFAYEVNPTFIRERYREAHDLIVRAWTEPGPFHFEGKHYDFRWVNVWPRPLQQPHPPIWIPGSGSMETIRFVAERRYPWIALPYSQFEVMKEHFDM